MPIPSDEHFFNLIFYPSTPRANDEFLTHLSVAYSVMLVVYGVCFSTPFR